MSEPSSLPPILAALDVSFWDEMWESVQDSSQPDGPSSNVDEEFTWQDEESLFGLFASELCVFVAEL